MEIQILVNASLSWRKCTWSYDEMTWENYGIFLSIVIYPVIQRDDFIACDSNCSSYIVWHWWDIVAFEAIREKLENGTYKEIASTTKVD
jgi:glycine C-acetyltransferase